MEKVAVFAPTQAHRNTALNDNTTTRLERSRRRWLGWTALAFAGVGLLWLYLVPLSTQMFIPGDGERDLVKVWLMTHGDWTPDGGAPVTGIAPHSADFIEDNAVEGRWHLKDIRLGTFWYRTIGILIRLTPDVFAIYALQTCLFVVGLLALFYLLGREIGPWAACSAGVLLALSLYVAQSITWVWHPAMFPGFACIWFALVYRALKTQDSRARTRWLLAAWCVQGILLQLHLVAAPYGAVLGLIQLRHWWRGGWRTAILSNLLSLVILVCASVFYVRVVLAVIEADTLTQTGGLPDFHTIIHTLITNFGSGWIQGATYSVNQSTSGWLTAILAAIGVAWSFRREAKAFERWTTVQMCIGVFMLVPTLSVGADARYLSAIVPGVFILAGYGVHYLRKCTHLLGPLVLTLVVGFNLFDPLLSRFIQTDHARMAETLGMVEKNTLFKRLGDKHGLNWTNIRQRVHGLDTIILTCRYIPLTLGLPAKPPSSTLGDDHFTVTIDGDLQPPISGAIDEFDGGSGRTIRLVRHRPRFDHGSVRFRVDDKPCVGSIPYRRLDIAVPLELLHDAGFPADVTEPDFVRNQSQKEHAPDAIQPCWLFTRAAENNVLTIELPPIEGSHPLTLSLLGKFTDETPQYSTLTNGVFDGMKPVRPLPTQKQVRLYRYAIPAQDGHGVLIRLPNAAHIGNLDLY